MNLTNITETMPQEIHVMVRGNIKTPVEKLTLEMLLAVTKDIDACGAVLTPSERP